MMSETRHRSNRCRLVAMGCAAALLLPAAMQAVAAPSMAAGSASGLPGAVIHVPVTFSRDASVTSLQFDITYDASRLEAGMAVAGTDISSHLLRSSVPRPGTQRVVISPTATLADVGKPALSGSNTLATIPFFIKGNARPASLPITLTNVIMSNATAARVAAGAVTGGSISVQLDTRDSDFDGMPDSYEVAFGLDPFDRSDANRDRDLDGLTNQQEYLLGTAADKADTDGDGVSDAAELANGTHPLDASNGTAPPFVVGDSDNDGVPDHIDRFPLDPTESDDVDGDGVGNAADTDDDNDGMPDSWESAYGLDPRRAADAQENLDTDTLVNLEEYLRGFDPTRSDTDGDGYKDDESNTSPQVFAGNVISPVNRSVYGFFNALDPNGDPLTFTIETNGQAGWVTVTDAGAGIYRYTPHSAAVTTDTFTFRAHDDRGAASALGTVTISLVPSSIFVVTKTADTNDGACSTDCSLREAIRAANATPGPDVVVLPAGTFTLGIAGAGEDAAATGDLDITDDIIVEGVGRDTTIIDGAALDRVFQVADVAARFSALTIRNGRSAESGAGVNIGSSKLIHFDQVRFTGNVSPGGYGGGIEIRDASGGPAQMLVTDSVFSGNCSGSGNGIDGTGAWVVHRSTVANNIAATGCVGGGGIYKQTGSLRLVSSSVTGNTAQIDGGGIAAWDAYLYVLNSTIADNVAGAQGGGVSVYGVVTSLVNSTITGNQAGTVAGGVALSGSAALVGIRNTLIGTNTAPTGPDCATVSTDDFRLNSRGNNIVSNTTDCPVELRASDIAANPGIGALVTDQIPGRTRVPLLAGSPAIDAGDNGRCPPRDQAQLLRPADGNGDAIARCDIGAYEYLAATGNRWPVAVGDRLSVAINGELNGMLRATDPDGDNLTFALATDGTLGSVTIVNPTTGAFIYTPDVDVQGNDSFSFFVSDGVSESAIANVYITIAPVFDGPYQQDGGVDGLVVIEAEDFDANITQAGKQWSAVSLAGYSGTGAMQSLPNTGGSILTGYDSTTPSPRLDYKISFVKTGTHYLWVRGWAASTADNSVHAGLNGVGPNSARNLDYGATYNTWKWFRKSLTINANSYVTVSAPGVHTLNAWMREDGFVVDKIILTVNPSYLPTGTGPEPSPRGPGAVNRAPNAEAGGPYSVVAGNSLTLNGTQSSDPDGDVLTYTWTFGDGSPPAGGATPAHIYSVAGTYIATLTVSDGFRSSVDQAMVTVTAASTNRAPVANVGGAYSGVAGTAIAFNGTASSDPDGDPLTYSWTFGDGGTATGISPSHTYVTTGTFTVTLTVSDGALSSTDQTTAVISAGNRAPVAEAGGPYNAVAGAPLNFDGSASTDPDGDPLSYLWNFGDGSPAASGISTTHVYGQAGTYGVVLSVSDNLAASSDSTTANIAVAGSGGGFAYQQSAAADGLVAIEAETRDGSVTNGTHAWAPVYAPSGYSGSGAMAANPNNNVSNLLTYEGVSPRLDFAINFVKTGIHYVWVRGYASSYPDDTVHIGMDGIASADGERFDLPSYNAWLWDNNARYGVAKVEISQPGIHFLSAWMSEDGFILDKIILTTDSAYVPAGAGPATNQRVEYGAPRIMLVKRIASGTDDAEQELSNGLMKVADFDLELGADLSKPQAVGMRYSGISIPSGAVITRAYLQYMVDEAGINTATLTVHGQASGNAAAFTSATGDISSRPLTAAAVNWQPAPWGVIGESRLAQRTPDLAAIIQEIITPQNGWVNGNALVLIVKGSGTRTADSFEGKASGAPVLFVEYYVP